MVRGLSVEVHMKERNAEPQVLSYQAKQRSRLAGPGSPQENRVSGRCERQRKGNTAAANQVLGAAEQLSSQSKDLAGQVNRFLSEVRAA